MIEHTFLLSLWSSFYDHFAQYLLDYFLQPQKRFFYLYIISSVVIALIYLSYHPRSKRINGSKYLWLHPSAKLDYSYFVITIFIKIVMIYPFILGTKEIIFFTQETLLEWLGYYPKTSLSLSQIMILFTLTLFIVNDFTRYWMHRFFHTIPFLWEFHKVHHSAKVLTPFTFYRVHPIENLLFGWRYAISIGIVSGVFLFFFGAKLGILQLFGVNLFVFIFSLIGSNLRHSHIRLSYPEAIERWFISPAQHQVHHSMSHFDKNFGGYLAIWDRCFGSLILSSRIKHLRFGIKAEQMPLYRSSWQLLSTPFISILKKWQKNV